MSEVIARFSENKVLFIKGEVDEGNKFRFSSNGNLEVVEIIEELDMTEPTFTRNSVAYLSDGTQVAANVPRFEQGKFGKAVMVEEGTMNLVSNGGVEKQGTSVASYQLDVAIMKELEGSVISISVDVADNYDGEHVVDIYLRRNDTEGGMINETRSGAFNVTSEYQRVNYSFILPVLGDITELFLYIRGNKYVSGGSQNEGTFITRNAQLEAKPYPTSFMNGTRAAERLTIPTEGVLNPQEGTVECWVYVNDASKYQNGYSTIFMADAGGSGRGIWLFHSNNSAYWKYQIKDENNNSKVITVADSEIPNGWHFFAIKWKSTEAKLFVDGVLKGTMGNPYLPSAIQKIDIGCWGAGNQLNSLIDDLRISNRARTDEEILAAYQSNKSLPVDKDTTYKLGFDNSLNPNKNINTIQIDKNRILFIPEFEEGVSF